MPLLDAALLRRGFALYHGHPGTIWRTTVQHVQVSWVGLEDEPASFALGFSTTEDVSPRFDGLGVLSLGDYAERRSIVEQALDSGDDLTGWLPPWDQATAAS